VAIYQFGEFELDTASEALSANGERVKLQAALAFALCRLVEHRGKSVHFAALRRDGRDDPSAVKVVHTTILALRRTIRQTDDHEYILNDWGVGYVFRAERVRVVEERNSSGPSATDATDPGSPRDASDGYPPSAAEVRAYLGRLIESCHRAALPPFLTHLSPKRVWDAQRVTAVVAPHAAESVELPTGVSPYWSEDVQRFDPSAALPESDPGWRWIDGRSRFRRVVITADAGLGKTTLLLGEAHRCAIAALTAIDEEAAADHPFELPLHARCDDVTLRLASGDSLERAIAQSATCADSADVRWLERHLQESSAVVLLDGLDELPSGSLDADLSPRDHLEHTLGRLVESEQGRRWRIIVASRRQGYRPPWRIRPSAEEGELEILPLSLVAVGPTLESWLGDDQALARAARVYLDANPTLKSLGRNPLLLTFIYMLVRGASGSGIDQLPASRAGLFEGVVGELVRAQWRVRERDRTERPSDAERTTRRLEEVALNLANSPTGWPASFPVDQLYDAMDPGTSPADLDDAILRLGVFVQLKRPGWGESVPYAFLHRTIHEYLVARALSHRPPAEAIEVVGNHLWFEPSWEQAIVMLAARLERPTALIRRLLDEPNDAFYQMTVLAGRCAQEAQFHGIEREVIAEIARRCEDALSSRSLLDQRRAADVAGALPTLQVARTALSHVRRLSDSSMAWLAFFARLRSEEALPELLEASRSPAVGTRRAAAVALGNQRDEAARQRLREVIEHDQDMWVVEGAIQALGRCGTAEDIPVLLRFLTTDSSPEQKRPPRLVRSSGLAAAGAAGILLVDDPGPLKALARHQRPDLRELACAALGCVRGQEADLLLLDLAGDTNRGVRTTAVVALEARDPDGETRVRLAAGLEALAEGFSWQEQIEMLSVVAKFSSTMPERLLKLLSGRPGPISSDLRDRLATRLRTATKGEEAIQLSHADSSWVRTLAAGLLAGRGFDAEARLRAMLLGWDEEYWLTRHEAARALAMVRGERARSALERSLSEDPAPVVRQAAAESLGRIGSRASIFALSSVLNDPDADSGVRGACATALALIGGESAEGALASAGETEEGADRSVLVEVLAARLNRGDRDAFHRLVALAKGADPLQSGQAYAALASFAPSLADSRDWLALRKALADCTRQHRFDGGFVARSLAAITRDALRERSGRLRKSVRSRLFGEHADVPRSQRTPALTEVRHPVPTIPSGHGTDIMRFTLGRVAGDDAIVDWVQERKKTAIAYRLEERRWAAWSNGDSLGDFVDEEAARAALAKAPRPDH